MRIKHSAFRFAIARSSLFAVILSFMVLVVPATLQAQSFGSLDRERGQEMLGMIKDEIKKNYYDPNFHGIDLDKRFKEAEGKVKQSNSLGQMFGVIAQVLIEFNDSHLFFLPPGRSYRTDYGYLMQMVGDKCYVMAVKPGSDAEAKGAAADLLGRYGMLKIEIYDGVKKERARFS